MPAPMTLTPQRTLEYQSDGSDEPEPSKVERKLRLKKSTKVLPPQSQKGHPCPQKGRPTGAKASYTRSQHKAIRASFTGTYAERDRLWFTMDTFLGARVSELADLRWSDVLFPDGTVRDSIYWSSWRQKGGWGKSPEWTPPPPSDPGHAPGCQCYKCLIFRGERQPKPHRPPPPRDIPLPYELHADLMDWKLRQASTPRGWHYDDFVFQSRKRSEDGGSRNISRQQMWFVLKRTVKRARLIDPSLMSADKYGTHSMRRTAINGVNDKTKDLGQASKFANHRNLATTSAYIVVDPRLIAEAVRSNATEWLAA